MPEFPDKHTPAYTYISPVHFVCARRAIFAVATGCAPRRRVRLHVCTHAQGATLHRVLETADTVHDPLEPSHIPYTPRIAVPEPALFPPMSSSAQTLESNGA